MHRNGINETPLISRLKIEVKKGSFSKKVAEVLYLSSLPGYWGIPEPKAGNLVTKAIFMTDRLTEIFNYIYNKRNVISTSSSYLIPGSGLYIYFQENSKFSKIEFNTDIRLRLKKWIFGFKEPIQEQDESLDYVKCLDLDKNFSDDIHGYLYRIIIDGDTLNDPIINYKLI